LYIFVLYINPNGQCVLPVYFVSVHQPIRSILLHQSYNIMFCNNTIYCFESGTNEFSWDSMFLIKFCMRNIINCCSDIILLFLSHNKLYFNDQINCFVINACIFLFSTLSRMVCLAWIYFVSTKTSQIHFIVSGLLYIVLKVQLISLVETVYF
jgi:hypothetical protein